ncbi:MAG: class I SAM-dependent methyltransferase [Hyphomicrobiaceae bacterium]
MNAAQLIHSRRWYHAFEVLPGLITPGRHFTDAAKIFDERFQLPADLSDKRALDVGTLDGPYAFELEKRGAIVTALDIQSPDFSGFNTAKTVRQSQATYVQGSVYDLDRLAPGPFDIIAFFGVWYHLKNPQAAFDAISRSLAEDGIVLFEGECLLNHIQRDGVDAELLQDEARVLSKSDLPISLFYPDRYKGDKWSWYVPNPACVRAWCQAAALDIVSASYWDDHPHQRMFGTARKIPGSPIRTDNPVWIRRPEDRGERRG